MTELAFLSPHLVDGGDEAAPRYRSPLARASSRWGGTIRDVSRLGKIEVRGDAGAVGAGDVVAITARRALVLCDEGDVPERLAALRRRFHDVVDVSAAYAGLEVGGEQLMRRLTDLDLDALPAVGNVARIRAVVLRDGDTLRLFFPQEYADYVADVVADAARGLA